jgi:DoxX-like protein
MQSGTQPGTASKKMLWAGRIVSALPVLLMVFGGTFGLLKPALAVPGFVHFGYPERLLLPICIVELVCAVLYAIPRTSVLGAILLTGYLGGATATHVRVGDPLFLAPVILGVLVWGGLYLRDGRLRGLIPLRAQTDQQRAG